jgi:predicted MFS family arabinose efflux permease
MLAFSMAYSQFLLILPGKAVLILAVLLFELGSLICAVAPGMTVLILGRAVSGVGASGIMGSCLIILSQVSSHSLPSPVPLPTRDAHHPFLPAYS